MTDGALPLAALPPLTIETPADPRFGDLACNIAMVVARELERPGWRVEREYYFNNAGRQMMLLGESVRARYLALIGRSTVFPEEGYQGEYIRDIARGLVEQHGEALADADGGVFRKVAERSILAAIRATQDRLGITFDHYFNENSLYESGALDRTLGA